LNVKKDLVVFGAGGHGKVVADVAMSAGFSLAGFVDDSPTLHGLCILGLPVLGNRQWFYQADPEAYTVVIAIGDNYLRFKLARLLANQNIDLTTIISPSAVISPSARIGRGTVVMPGVVVNADAVVGEGAILNTGTIVEHDVMIGQFVHVSPNAALGGAAEVGDLAHIGIGSTVLPLVCIGSRSILGAGSLATRNISNDVVAFGSPARVRRSISFDPSQMPESIS
jgi:sugar O-acyltransferase (sialic acid O-acetyltransferase NeuD family)